MKRVLFGVLASSALLTACATETGPVCRAPHAYEMAAFAAVISHSDTALAQAHAPGTVRDAINGRDPSIQSYIWGNQGQTRGSVIGLLTPPPLCVIDDPTFEASDAVRQIVVYPQSRFDRYAPIPGSQSAPPVFPYGSLMGDYMTCRFRQTASGWKLSDMCGYRGRITGSYTG